MSRVPKYAPRTDQMPRYVNCPTCPDNGIKVAEDGKTHLCWDCNSLIGDYTNHQGNGYQSITYDHLHVLEVDSKSASSPVRRELCLSCYQIDFAKAYPEEKCPV